MARKGPLITLLGGAALAAVLLGVNIHASTGPAKKNTAAKAAATTAAPAASGTAGAARPAPSQSSAEPIVAVPANPAQATYAGATVGGVASIAIAIHNDVAVAYVCDGRKVESWLRGTATGGQLNLTGTHGGTLTGTFGNGWATGSVAAAGHNWTFRVKAVYKPSGLYRTTASVRKAAVTWIVVDKIQVGVQVESDQANPAPPLDVDTLTSTVDGTTVSAEQVDGATGAGF
jgi:serine/threonine-protein kinase